MPPADTKAGVLPLVAFYGRDQQQEELRNRFYSAMERAMAFREDDFPDQMGGGKKPHWTLVDLRDAIAVVNANSSPIEFLVSRGEMQTGRDLEGMGGVRFHTALRLRDLIDGARVNGMKSPNLEGGGGGGGKSADIRGYQLDCIKLLGRVKADMPEQWIFPMLESVVFMDEWMDLWPVTDGPVARREALRKRRLKTIQALHFALDRASLSLGYMQENDFRQRWGLDAPAQPYAARRHTQASTASNQLGLLTSQGARKR
ncbi:hypothetical protein [Rhizobium sp. CF080]|uniref:hypothetical protein n=1 Tax=Rhizobium sp. (strain CF080) TaxID=1144310 RepID=UPI0012DE5C3F|nr:hypothetical protein [Rhizobium sp. CF080]